MLDEAEPEKWISSNFVAARTFRDGVGYDVRVSTRGGNVDVPFSDIQDLILVLQKIQGREASSGQWSD